MTINVWTDGACDGRGVGGWAWVTDEEFSAQGGVPNTTNQRMELMAAWKAVQTLGEMGAVHVTSDSAYVVNCFLAGWRAGWSMVGDVLRKRNGDAVANADLWLLLFAAVDSHRKRWGVAVQWTHVRGHAGDRWNERADALAVEAREMLAAGLAER